jgi:N-carbamoyl-L-amino-acid hydrolase
MSAAALRAQIDSSSLRTDFEDLRRIGATADGGMNRPTFSEAHLAARRWFLMRAAAAGLVTRVDAAGNHSAVLPSRQAEAPTLLLGSHLDSVPHGGGFDGALGVVAALHVLLAVQQAGVELPFTLEAIDFTDEEGTLLGLLGSQALTGSLRKEALENPRGGREALLRGLVSAGLTEDGLFAARRDPRSLAGYLELHIEQGPTLERERIDIGVATTIVGSRSFRIVLQGAGGHAGTTPMDARRDAGVVAASIILALREIARQEFAGSVVTVGDVRFEPGAFNVIPKTARLSLEFRSQDAGALDAMERAMLARINAEAGSEGVDVAITPVARWPPSRLDPRVSDAIQRTTHALGLSSKRLPSGAGHDAQELTAVTPSGLIFVPSVGGISHDPREFTRWDDVLNGANVLLGTVLDLAGGGLQ